MSSSSNQVIRAEIAEIGFSLYTDTDIRALSVCKITSSVAIDALGNVIQGGLEDPKLGLIDSKSGACVTCGLNFFNCPGHMGNIELCVPVSISKIFHFVLLCFMNKTIRERKIRRIVPCHVEREGTRLN